MGELKYFKICTGWIKICQVSRLTWVFLSCGLFLESPENFSDARFARRIREICDNRSVPRYFLTILAGFILFNPLRANFGACDKLTAGLTLDLRKVLCTSLLQREYKI